MLLLFSVESDFVRSGHSARVIRFWFRNRWLQVPVGVGFQIKGKPRGVFRLICFHLPFLSFSASFTIAKLMVSEREVVTVFVFKFVKFTVLDRGKN